MVNLAEPVVKNFIESLHKCIDRKSRNLSSSYDSYVMENRVIKLLCGDKTLTPRDCAEQMNARYETALNGEDIIRLLKANRLSYQTKRGELLDWAANLAEAFAKVLESCKQTDFDEYLALRSTVIQTRDDERYKIQERIACLMFCVKYPELFSDADAEAIEQFGNVYMKHLLYDATDLLKNLCGKNKISKKLANMTLQDFLQFLYAKYPALADGTCYADFAEFNEISMREILNEATTFLNRPNESITTEDFLQNDPDAQNMLIAPTSSAE